VPIDGDDRFEEETVVPDDDGDEKSLSPTKSAAVGGLTSKCKRLTDCVTL